MSTPSTPAPGARDSGGPAAGAEMGGPAPSERRPNGLHAAFAFFSAVPMPAFTVVDAETGRRAMRWFWLMGALVGAVAGLVGFLVAWLAHAPLLAAALVVGVLALATGAIHLDGVADTADGLGSRQAAADALTIMRKSDIGPMGVATLVLVLLVEVASLAQLAWQPAALALAAVAGPALGRLMMLPASTPGVRMARTSGFGAIFGGVTPVWAAVVGLVAAPVALGLTGFAVHGAHGAVAGVLAAVLPTAFAWTWRRHLDCRLGGMTGDTYGSIIELTQATCWLVLALAW